MNKRSVQGSIICIVILSLMLFACQSVIGFSPFATATPTRTATFTPSPTFTTTPSPTSTQTPTTTAPPAGIIVEEQLDGRALVIDHDNKYQLLLPLHWTVVFSSQKELQQVLQAKGAENPGFAQIAENLKDVNPDIFRLAATNADRNYVHTGFPTLLTINAYTDPIASTMPMSFVTAMIEDNILEGATSTAWDVINNINQVEVGIVKGVRTINIPNGPSLNIQELVISFQSNKKLIVAEIAAPEEFGDQLLAPFDNIIDSIEVNKP